MLNFHTSFRIFGLNNMVKHHITKTIKSTLRTFPGYYNVFGTSLEQVALRSPKSVCTHLQFPIIFTNSDSLEKFNKQCLNKVWRRLVIFSSVHFVLLC